VLRGDLGYDTLDGSTGDDVIYARDGEPDDIRCGPGTDTAYVDDSDYPDLLLPENGGDCETVRIG
jgi:Ca2+-binding RTX toxin-like protein